MSSFDLGGSLDVLAGEGTLTLSVRDLFNTCVRRSTIDADALYSISDSQWRRAQSVDLAFTYRLDQEEREGRSGGGGEEGERD